MARQFGVLTTADDVVTAAMLQTSETTATAEIAEARDNNGKVTDQKAYSKTQEVRMDYLIDSGDTDLPAAGAEVETSALTGLATNVSRSETNTGYATGSFTVQLKDAADQVEID